MVVTDKQGAPITGLKAEDFEIVEEGKPQAITYFTEGDPEDGDNLGEVLPLHLGLPLDTSGSMERDIQRRPHRRHQVPQRQRRGDGLHPRDFDTEVRVARYGADETERLIERIRRRKPDGWTALYDAVGVYLNGVGALDGQKILLALHRRRRHPQRADVLRPARPAQVVRRHGLRDRLPRESVGQRPHAAADQLQRMAAITGGQAFFPASVKELDKIYDKIQREIAARYSLGYISTDTRKDGAWRKVEIKLKRPDLKGAKLRTRTGYFAPYRAGQPLTRAA